MHVVSLKAIPPLRSNISAADHFGYNAEYGKSIDNNLVILFVKNNHSFQSPRNSDHGSTASLTDLPDPGLPKTPLETSLPRPKTPEKAPEDLDSSKLTCSPFASPLQDITNETRNARKSLGNKDECIIINDSGNNVSNGIKQKEKENFVHYDDDVTIIIDTKPEIIALSSDDDEVRAIFIVFAILFQLYDYPFFG